MKKLICLIVLIMLVVFTSSAMAAQFKWRSGRTGGGGTKLDGITGYATGDPAIVVEATQWSFYRFDSTITTGENDPFEICPDDVGSGDCSAGSWVLVRVIKNLEIDKSTTGLGADENGKVFSNKGAGALRTYTMPECTAQTMGWIAGFLVIDAYAIRIDPHANDSIADESDGEAGEYIQSDTTKGSAVTILCVEETQSGTESDAYNLITYGQIGTWTTQD